MPKGVPRDQSIQHTILHRMKIARGHLDRVIAMVETGHYCIDVIHQSMAVQAALKQTDELLLNNNMDKIIVTAAGLSFIAAIYWFFFGKKEETMETKSAWDIVVDGGYKPAVIKIPPGKPATIIFTRKD